MPNNDKTKTSDPGDTLSSQPGLNNSAASEKTDSDVPALAPAIAPEIDNDQEAAKNAPLDVIPAPDPDEQPPDQEDTAFDDEKTDRAIDEIIAKEGDDLLAAQDIAAAAGSIKIKPKGTGFWRKKWVRSVLVFIIFAAIVAAVAVPKSRYWVLNTAGIRSSSSVVVVDSTTQLPLKGVHVAVGGQKAQTDSEGEVTLRGLRLGPAQLTVSQVGFQEIKRDVVIGWGSNPFGNIALKASGVQFVIRVTDYLSQKPIAGVEATDGQTTAVSGNDGKITLTLSSAAVPKDGITLSKAGYRTDAISLNEDAKKATDASLVLARKTVFVTKQGGTYDLYKSDLDGKNQKVLLAGTGHENSNLSLVMSQDGARAAFVSTRDNKRDSGGFLQSSLMLVNVENGSTLTIAQAAQIQLIDWVGTRLIFQVGSSDSGASDRYTVVSYNYGDNTRLNLASAKKLSAVISAKGLIYYAIGEDLSSDSVEVGLFKIGPDGKGGQRVVEDELSTVLRSTYGTLSLQTVDGTWLAYDLANGSKTQVGTPASLANRLYIDNDGRTKSLWVGQSALLTYDVASAKDTTLATKSGLTYPIQWAGGGAVVYRVSSGSETADYAVSLDGGTPRKIADVSPTYGFSQAQ